MGNGKTLSRLASLVLMPQLSSSYAFAILALAYPSSVAYLAVAIVFSSVVQIASLLAYARKSGERIDVASVNGRVLLFTIATSSYLVGFAVLWRMGAPYIMTILMLCYAVSTIVAALFTKYVTRVSIHVWGLSGPSVTVLYAYGIPGFAGMLALATAAGTARLVLHKHTLNQVLLSFLLSLPITASIVYIIGPALL